MLPRVKNKIIKFYNENKNLVKNIVIVAIIVIILLLLYKILFYSNAQSAVYGTRLTDIKDNKITKEKISNLSDYASNIEKIDDVKIKINGRLLKYFIYINEDVSNDDLKNKIDEINNNISGKIKGYYDIEFYVINTKDENESYPIIGYKHKNSEVISFDEF